MSVLGERELGVVVVVYPVEKYTYALTGIYVDVYTLYEQHPFLRLLVFKRPPLARC